MIEAKISKYYDNDFLSIDLEYDSIVFANINIETKELKVDIYKIAENFCLDLKDLMSKLQYAKDELLKTYPEFDNN
jgi:hypothetical protein